MSVTHHPRRQWLTDTLRRPTALQDRQHDCLSEGSFALKGRPHLYSDRVAVDWANTQDSNLVNDRPAPVVIATAACGALWASRCSTEAHRQEALVCAISLHVKKPLAGSDVGLQLSPSCLTSFLLILKDVPIWVSLLNSCRAAERRLRLHSRALPQSIERGLSQDETNQLCLSLYKEHVHKEDNPVREALQRK